MAQLGHADPKMTLGLYARTLTSKSRRAGRALPDDRVDSRRGTNDDGTVQLIGATVPDE
jgi:hypothetical protein